MAKSELEILVEAKVNDAIKGLNKVDKSIGNMKKSTSGAAGQMQSMRKAVGATIGKMAAGIGTIVAFAAAYKQTTEAFFRQEEAVRNLESAVDRNSSTTSLATASLQEYASQLQSVTTIGDETTMQLAAMTISMGRTEEETKKIISAAADASAALGITMEAAIRSLNKSYSGLSGELGELVPEMNDLTQEQKEAGDAVDLVAKKFEGASEALADTASGGVKQLSNAWGDYKEMIGGVVAEGMAPFNTWLKRVLENAVKTRDRLREVSEALANPDSVEATEQTLENLKEERDIVRSHIAENQKLLETEADIAGTIQGGLTSQQTRLRQLERIIAQKEIELEYNEKAAEGQELLAEQEARRRGYIDEFAAAEQRVNEIVSERKDPLQREIDALQERIDKLAVVREKMKETGQWDQSYQDTINELVNERDRLEQELIEKRNEGNESGEEEVEQQATLSEYQQKRLALEEKIAAARLAMQSSSGAESDYYGSQLESLRSQYNELTGVREELSGYERSVQKITAAWGQAETAVAQFGGVIDGLKGVYGAWSDLQQNNFDQYKANMDKRIEAARKRKEEELEIIREEYGEKESALEEQLESDAISREEYLARKEELEAERKKKEEKARKEEEKLEKQLRKKQIEFEKKQFKAEKAQSIANAVMSGAEAAVKALTAGPFLGPALASMIAGLTAAQVAMIKQQEYVPPPLAEGGVVMKPTVAEIGEGGEPEAIVPLSKAKDMGFSGGGGSGDTYSITINGDIYGIADLERKIFYGIQKAQKSRRLPAWQYTS